MTTAEKVAVDWQAAELECDVVMKGGITSGVIYPRALTEFAKTYRFRGVGGASAGAIGAAFAAAAEFGRATGGFDLLEQIPDDLGDGKLDRLFQAQPSTAPLLHLLKSATDPTAVGVGGKLRSVLRSLRQQFRAIGLLGAVPGAIVVIVGILVAIGLATSGTIVLGILAGLVVVVSGLIILVLGWVLAVGSRVAKALTVALPENLFGICRGLSTGPEEGLTDWLSARIDEIAGLSHGAPPLTFGQLWGTGDAASAETDAQVRQIDLRMVSTCLSRTRPYEMPWDARNFFYSPDVWRTLFPGYVVDALLAADDEPPLDSEWAWTTQRAAAQGLHRLPGPADLPVIVATRLSLSFPLLISAIPLHSVDFRSDDTKAAFAAHRAGQTSTVDLHFETLWFTDGGLCSNFPISMFDSPLPTRPTFGINLGKLPEGAEPSTDQTLNIDWASTNRDGLLPPHRAMAERGAAAVGDFALAAIDTARNWQDNSYLDVPGYRDRIVRVLQSGKEGGLNLNMDSPTITGLAERGRMAASTMINQFNQPHYSGGATGWQNHRWVRYRALLAGMPDFLRGYHAGREALAPVTAGAAVNPANPPVNIAAPPGYSLTVGGVALGDDITTGLFTAAAAVDAAGAGPVAAVQEMPRAGRIRRVPQI